MRMQTKRPAHLKKVDRELDGAIQLTEGTMKAMAGMLAGEYPHLLTRVEVLTTCDW